MIGFQSSAPSTEFGGRGVFAATEISSLVEVNRKNAAQIPRQHRINANDLLSLQMRRQHHLIQRLIRRMRAVRALHLRLPAHRRIPPIRADRAVPDTFLLPPLLGIDVDSAMEERHQQRDFIVHGVRMGDTIGVRMRWIGAAAGNAVLA